GSKFYGMTFDADLANTFLSGAGFDQDAYNKKVKEYDTAFYAESGHDEDNIQAYLTQVNEIQNGDDYGDTYSERQKRYLREALDNAFEQTTGHKAPTDDDIAAYNEQAQAARNSGKEPFSLKTFLFGDKEKQTDKQAEEQKEGTTADETPKTERAEKQTAGGQTAAAPEVQGPARQTENRAEVQGPVRQSTMTPDEAIAAQGGMTFEQWRAAELPRNLEQTAEEARAQELDALKADAENRTPAQTPEAAMTLYLKGEMLTDDEYSLISAYADSNAGKHLLNREGFVSSLDTASASLQKQAKSLYVPSTIPTEIGSTLEDAVGILKSGILDADTTGMGYLSLIQIMQDADAWIESGAVSIPSGKNPYNVYISTHDDANLVIQNIKEAQRTAVKQQQNEVTAQKQAEEEAYGASVERLTNGNGTEEDFQRVLGTSGFGSGAKRTDATYKE
ncbi:MAG: hypothetical protein Q3982_08865, partial [Phoenicibacter congonensis]|nr:hypothetical protein [Phoenicibacter congonensis]